MARITHPRPQIGTIVDRLGGVIFRDGFAEVDLSDKPNLAAAYKQHGYLVEENTTGEPIDGLTVRELRAELADMTAAIGSLPAGESPFKPIIDLTKLSARELRDVADIEGIEYPAKATKAQLVDLNSRAPAEPSDDPDAEQLPPYIVPLTADED